jgi:hypothetical protein
VPFLLRNLPFFEQNTLLSRPDGPPLLGEDGQPLFSFHDQIVFWASLAPSRQVSLPSSSPLIPVVIDTGFNDALLLRETQLVHWGLLEPRSLRRGQRALQIHHQLSIPKYEIDLWIHPNQPGERDRLAGSAAVRIELPDGVPIWPAAVPGGKRLPLLGTRALAEAGLLFSVEGGKRPVQLELPDGQE